MQHWQTLTILKFASSTLRRRKKFLFIFTLPQFRIYPASKSLIEVSHHTSSLILFILSLQLFTPTWSKWIFQRYKTKTQRKLQHQTRSAKFTTATCAWIPKLWNILDIYWYLPIENSPYHQMYKPPAPKTTYSRPTRS